jgi:hypothetical protein
MEKEKIFEELKSLWEEFEKNHLDTTKVSNMRARTALGKIKKLITPYRTASTLEDKK